MFAKKVGSVVLLAVLSGELTSSSSQADSPRPQLDAQSISIDGAVGSRSKTGAVLGVSNQAVFSAREKLFGPSGAAMPELPPARLIVFFHPDFSSCQPQEARLIRSLVPLREEIGIAMISVVPDFAGTTTERYGEPLPGFRWQVPAETYAREGALSPRPRIEVWSGDGRLLLLRSAPNGTDPESLVREVLAARAFTSPVATR